MTKYKESILGTQTQIICMVMQSLNLFQDADSDGQILKTLTQINAATIVPKHVLEIDLEYPKKKS